MDGVPRRRTADGPRREAFFGEKTWEICRFDRFDCLIDSGKLICFIDFLIDWIMKIMIVEE